MIARIEAIQNFDRRLANVDRIKQRIAEIESQFGINRPNGQDFQSILNKELMKNLDVNQTQQVNQIEKTSEVQQANKVTKSTGVQQANQIQQANQNLNTNSNTKVTNEDVETFALPEEEYVETPSRDSKRFTYNSNSTVEDMIQDAAYKYGVDSKLVKAIATAESNMNQNEISSAGAIGVMQLMPETAAGLGIDPYDEQQNIEGGAMYLKQMLERFGGNIRNAVAAYNAGPGAVEKFGGVPPYGETQHYVGKVLDLYR